MNNYEIEGAMNEHLLIAHTSMMAALEADEAGEMEKASVSVVEARARSRIAIWFADRWSTPHVRNSSIEGKVLRALRIEERVKHIPVITTPVEDMVESRDEDDEDSSEDE